MPEMKIHIIGYDEIVLILGLLGIDGTAVENIDDFLTKFNELIKNSSIGMIIIAFDLPDNIINDIGEYKLNNRRPFIFILPDIFQADIDTNDIFLNRIYKSIKKIIL